MKFVDLEKLKIVREHNFATKEIGLVLNHADTIFDIKEKVRCLLEDFFVQTKIEVYFHVYLTTDETIKDLDDADAFFTTFVNIFTAVFLDEMCIKPHIGRARERRLDVPDTLKVATVNMSLLKRNINMKTYCDRFNIGIEWYNDGMEYQYNMVPQREDEDYDN